MFYWRRLLLTRKVDTTLKFAKQRPPIPAVVAQHSEDTISLRHTRSVLVRAPHVKLLHLSRLDERLLAHLDGLRVAGDYGAQILFEALDPPTTGAVFAAGVSSIESENAAGVQRLVALARALPEAWRGVVSALGWVSAATLRNVANAWLNADDAFLRRLGLAACATHRVDPGRALDAALQSEDAPLRNCALRVAAEVGRQDLLSACTDTLNKFMRARSEGDSDQGPAATLLHAARSSLLLGERRNALEALSELALAPGPWREQALEPLLLAADALNARNLLERIAQQRDDTKPDTVRRLIRAVAYAGDPYYVDWLLQVMQDQKLARIAGESFSFITGADLAWLDLERKPPEEPVAGPNDNPDDADVALDEDDGLPWPDTERVRNWWSKHASEFRPDTRYLVGAPPTPEHCIRILREGTQRQRYAAAVTLCLLRPGTPLFNIAAPAWRQQRLLAAMC
jgi:uncharacterized protein (TIGR02270 family)